jgi:hypothetical protein
MPLQQIYKKTNAAWMPGAAAISVAEVFLILTYGATRLAY